MNIIFVSLFNLIKMYFFNFFFKGFFLCLIYIICYNLIYILLYVFFGNKFFELKKFFDTTLLPAYLTEFVEIRFLKNEPFYKRTDSKISQVYSRTKTSLIYSSFKLIGNIIFFFFMIYHLFSKIFFNQNILSKKFRCMLEKKHFNIFDLLVVNILNVINFTVRGYYIGFYNVSRMFGLFTFRPDNINRLTFFFSLFFLSLCSFFCFIVFKYFDIYINDIKTILVTAAAGRTLNRILKFKKRGIIKIKKYKNKSEFLLDMIEVYLRSIMLFYTLNFCALLLKSSILYFFGYMKKSLFHMIGIFFSEVIYDFFLTNLLCFNLIFLEFLKVYFSIIMIKKINNYRIKMFFSNIICI